MFFEGRGYVATTRNSIPIGGEWLSNTTMKKQARRRPRRRPRHDKERLYLFDTTLRDGAQTTGVDFSLEDKRLIAKTLDELGVDYIEGGYPGANVTDTEFFAADRARDAQRFTAFGMTKRAGRSVVQRSGLPGHCCRPRPAPSASSPRRGTITCAWRSASRTRRTSQVAASRSRSRPAVRPGGPVGKP